ncbi:MAG: regulatory protein RecX [Methylomonas sp.]
MTTANLQTSIELKQNIQQICLRLLAMREHSQRELLDKLALRGYSRSDVEPIIAEFAEQGWQDNQRFAECYARQRMIKGYGPVRIRYELQQRGIVDVDLEQLAEANVGGWINSLLEIYSNKYNQASKLSRAEWLKRSRFLQQRGFSHEMIKQLLVELKIKIA